MHKYINKCIIIYISETKTTQLTLDIICETIGLGRDTNCCFLLKI